MMISNLSPCPKCGGHPVITMHMDNPYSEAMEIQCTRCGLTLYFNSEYAWTPNGVRIVLGGDITWSYRDRESKSAIEAWNNAQ